MTVNAPETDWLLSTARRLAGPTYMCDKNSRVSTATAEPTDQQSAYKVTTRPDDAVPRAAAKPKVLAMLSSGVCRQGHPSVSSHG